MNRVGVGEANWAEGLDQVDPLAAEVAGQVFLVVGLVPPAWSASSSV